jgi:hypothetical protein
MKVMLRAIAAHKLGQKCQNSLKHVHANTPSQLYKTYQFIFVKHRHLLFSVNFNKIYVRVVF